MKRLSGGVLPRCHDELHEAEEVVSLNITRLRVSKNQNVSNENKLPISFDVPLHSIRVFGLSREGKGDWCYAEK